MTDSTGLWRTVPPLTLAGEAAVAKSGPTAAGGGPDVHTLLVAGFGVLNVPNTPVQLLARVDYLDPNTRSAATAAACTNAIGFQHPLGHGENHALLAIEMPA